ncbi:MAG: hypothetical protein F9B45_20585 [Phycisphaera sp. RhM]|nr:hypothetical protein [Phycisphaera sp. RhM]
MRTHVLVLVAGLAFSVGLLLAQDPIPRDEIGLSILEKLNRLHAEKLADYELLVKKHGEEHPSVARLKFELSNLSSMQEQKLKQLPGWARKNVSVMNDDELRTMVGVLVERVAKLESEVKSLKHPEAKIELLSAYPSDLGAN